MDDDSAKTTEPWLSGANYDAMHSWHKAGALRGATLSLTDFREYLEDPGIINNQYISGSGIFQLCVVLGRRKKPRTRRHTEPDI